MAKSKLSVVGFLLAVTLPMGALAQRGGGKGGGGGGKSTTSKLPVIDSISPSSADSGASSLILTADGANFTMGSIVRWNGADRSTTFLSETRLQATIGSLDLSSVGTAAVTVVTPGRKGGESNPVTFTITEAYYEPPPPEPEPPPPSPDPLEITTTSAPPGTAGNNYSANLEAAGGAPAYLWGVASGGGALPPGLALQADGTITGSPTEAGTFTFTAQALDQASQIAQRVLSITVDAPPTTTSDTSTSSVESTPPLFQYGFEGGNFAGWEFVWNTSSIKVNTDPQFAHSGSNSAQIHYVICGASDGSCGGSSQDSNRYLIKFFNSNNGYPNGLDHFFMRGYVYFKSPEPGAAKDGVQRKILWVQDQSMQWSFFLTSFADSGQIPLTFGANGNAYVPPFNIWNIATVGYDRWHCLEMEVKLNTPGTNDAVITLWVDGNQVFQRTNLNLRGGYTTGAAQVSYGRQANRYNYDPVDEYRYWDDIVISTSYVGP